MLQKRLLGFLLAACLVFSFSACASNSAPPASGNAAATKAATAAATTAKSAATAAATTAASKTTAAANTTAASASNQDAVNLVVYTMGDPPPDAKTVEDAVNAKLKEKLNCTVNFQMSTWTDYQQKYANEITSGNADIIYSAGWLNYAQLARAGAYLELEDLAKQYAPDLYSQFPESQLNACKVDGTLYGLPNLWPEYVINGIAYRQDLAEKLNLPAPNTIENAQAYFKGIKDADPNQRILQVTTENSVGTVQAFDAASIFALKYPWVADSGIGYGLTADFNTPSNVVDYWNSQDFIDDCKLLKTWGAMGFWSKSALSDTNDNNAFINGTCVAIINGENPNKYVSIDRDFASAHPDWKVGYLAYGETTGVLYPSHPTQNLSCITRSCKNPERAMQVINYLMTDEAMNHLVQCGVEGVHYELKDGIYHNLSTANPPPFNYEAFSTWNLRVQKFKLIQESDVKLNALFSKYHDIAQKTSYPDVNIFGGFAEDYTEYDAERTAVMNVMKQYLAPIQAGLVDDVEGSIKDFLSKANAAGLQTCRDSFKQQWLDYCNAYGYK